MLRQIFAAAAAAATQKIASQLLLTVKNIVTRSLQLALKKANANTINQFFNAYSGIEIK